MKDIVIIGAGGFGREVQWLIEEINMKENVWNLLGFVDDNIKVGTIINDAKVIGNVEWLKTQNFYVVCAIADPNVRRKIINQLLSSENIFPILIHPNVQLSKYVMIGDGAIICSSSILTVNIRIGKHVIIDFNSTIGHDATIGDYSTILPCVSVSGYAKIGEEVTIGTGARIIQNLSVGNNTIIGAGAIVTRDIPENVVAVGVPAKSIKKRS
jgi:sugar O-acyltransferase (sialic acid O-acetyltransferase NeuD family)